MTSEAGEAEIAGGIRDCDHGPVMIMVTASWTRLVAVRLDGDLVVTDIGQHIVRESFAVAMNCG